MFFLQVLVHDNQIQPLYQLENPILLTPGFGTRVAIRLNKFAKKTESIGRCVSFRYLYLQPAATVYFREACYLQCITEQIIRTCSCFPPYAPSGSALVRTQLLNGSMHLCWEIDDVMCQLAQERRFLETGVGVLCDDQCDPPCDEIKYSSHSSSAQFPPAHLGEVFARSYGFASVESFRRNYLMVEFYVESLLMPTIEEVQDMEIGDLISSLGGIVGFYLGMHTEQIIDCLAYMIDFFLQACPL